MKSTLILALMVVAISCIAPISPTPCTIEGVWLKSIPFSEACSSPVEITFARNGMYMEETFFPLNCTAVPDSLEGSTRLLTYGTYTDVNTFIQPIPIITYHRDVLGGWDTIFGGDHVGIDYVALMGCDTLPFTNGVMLPNGLSIIDTLIRF